MNLLLVESAELSSTARVTVTGARARHLIEVLRAAPGSSVRVGVIDGPRGAATVLAADDNRVVLDCAFDAEVPARPSVDLLLALPRPKVMRRLWAQIAALGVGRIVLTNAERVERNYFDTHVLSPGTYRPLLIEGLQQARDTRLPEVTIHRQFRPLVEDELDRLSPVATRVAADPSGEQSMAHAIGAGTMPRVLLAVGPEGGWNRFELDLLTARGFELASMGRRTLRSDTACVALLTLTHAALAAGPGAPPG